MSFTEKAWLPNSACHSYYFFIFSGRQEIIHVRPEGASDGKSASRCPIERQFRQFPNGDREIRLPNGQREVHSASGVKVCTLTLHADTLCWLSLPCLFGYHCHCIHLQARNEAFYLKNYSFLFIGSGLHTGGLPFRELIVNYFSNTTCYELRSVRAKQFLLCVVCPFGSHEVIYHALPTLISG